MELESEPEGVYACDMLVPVEPLDGVHLAKVHCLVAQVQNNLQVALKNEVEPESASREDSVPLEQSEGVEDNLQQVLLGFVQ